MSTRSVVTPVCDLYHVPGVTWGSLTFLLSKVISLIVDLLSLRLIQATLAKDKENWATYKRIRNSTTKLIAEAKAEFYQTRLESNAKNPKEIWKTINNLMNRKDSKSTIIKMTFDNKKVSDPQEIANRLNEHFASVGTRLASKLPEDSKHFEDYIKPARCGMPGKSFFFQLPMFTHQ